MFELPPAESDENGRGDFDPPASGSRPCQHYGTDQRRARRRERYLDAVIQAIRTTGADATMAELAAGAGVSKPVLYDLFGDRLGLTTAVVTKLGDISASEHRLDRANELPGLAELFDSFVEFVEHDPEIYRWVLRCSADQSELLRQLIPVTIQGRQLQRLVEAAADGEPEAVDVTSIAIAGFAVAAIDSWLASRDICRSDLVAYLSKFVANGLGSQQRQPRTL